jgi:hypothetical protein
MRDEVAETLMPEPTVSCEKEHRPSKQEALRDYEISIRFLSRGCIVRVGCKEIAFEDVTKAMEAINAYVANPWDEQQKWHKILD